MYKNAIEILEIEEMLKKISDNNENARSLVEALLTNENKCYTKKARLNKSGLSRAGVEDQAIGDTLKECREILRNESPA